MNIFKCIFLKKMNRVIRDIIVGVTSGAAYETLKSGCKGGIDAL